MAKKFKDLRDKMTPESQEKARIETEKLLKECACGCGCEEYLRNPLAAVLCPRCNFCGLCCECSSKEVLMGWCDSCGWDDGVLHDRLENFGFYVVKVPTKK